jgi:hypothetical protein
LSSSASAIGTVLRSLETRQKALRPSQDDDSMRPHSGPNQITRCDRGREPPFASSGHTIGDMGMPHPARSCFHIRPLHLLAAAAALLFSFGGAVHASEQCAAQPNLKAAPGSHWYYRVDRASQRKCWFLARAGMKVGQPAPAKAQSAAKPQPLPDAPGISETTRTGWHSPDPRIAAAENAGSFQSTPFISVSAHDTESDAGQDSGTQPQATSAEELPTGPVLAALETPALQPQMHAAVAPARLLALLAAALGLAAVVGRLVFRYSVLFSA